MGRYIINLYQHFKIQDFSSITIEHKPYFVDGRNLHSLAIFGVGRKCVTQMSGSSLFHVKTHSDRISLHHVAYIMSV